MTRSPLPVVAFACGAVAIVVSLASSVSSQTGATASHVSGTEKSGYVYAEPQTRAMQDDDFSNPGFLWVDKGKALFATVEGTAGKSCASCHGADGAGLKGAAATYPKYVPALGRVVDIEQRIDDERISKMGAPALVWESDGLLALTAFVKLQSRGVRVNVATGGGAHATWLAGKTFYETRRGQLDMSCAQCHEQNNDRKLRTETLSQGQTNDFPVYRLSWQTLGSVQRRFRECNEQIRAEPLAYGSAEYVALELYVASRGQGLALEAPGVRK
jgi:sulfur-oxidizing protein SoxA